MQINMVLLNNLFIHFLTYTITNIISNFIITFFCINIVHKFDFIILSVCKNFIFKIYTLILTRSYDTLSFLLNVSLFPKTGKREPSPFLTLHCNFHQLFFLGAVSLEKLLGRPHDRCCSPPPQRQTSSTHQNSPSSHCAH